MGIPDKISTEEIKHKTPVSSSYSSSNATLVPLITLFVLAVLAKQKN